MQGGKAAGRTQVLALPFSNSGHLIILACWNAVAQMSGSPAGEHTCSAQGTRPLGRQGHCHWAPPSLELF